MSHMATIHTTTTLKCSWRRESYLSSIKCIIHLLMSGLVDDAKDAGDKMKAGAKAAGKKMDDPDRDASTEYNKEKVKEKVEDL
jgi:hypothetical protein